MTREQHIDDRYVALQQQLSAAAAKVDAWRANAEATGGAAFQTMLEVAPVLTAVKAETDVTRKMGG